MFKNTFFISCVLIGMVFLLIYFFQRHLIYFPDRHKPKLQAYQATDMTAVSLTTKDNIRLTSWYKPSIDNQPTILYLHGNAGHIGHRMPLIRQFIHMGMGVFILEYRGYGGNRGSPSEQGLYEDGQTALQFLKQSTSKKIVLYGESLGTGVATKLALDNQICALILQSPFTSLTRIARFHYPWIFIKPWDSYNSLERIKLIKAPLLILHGMRDHIVPYSEGLTLFNEANEPKEMQSFTNSEHNNLWDNPSFSKKVIHFIQTHCN